MFKGIKEMIWTLIPPNGDESQIRKWRLAVATGLITALAVWASFLTFSVGGFAFVGADGFAMAGETPSKAEVAALSAKVDSVESEVRDVGRKVDKMELRDMRRSLLETKREVCTALHVTGNERQQDYWIEREAALKAEYRRTTGVEMDLPVCEEMGF